MNFASILSFETDVLQPQCMNANWNFEYNMVVQVRPCCIAMLGLIISLAVMYRLTHDAAHTHCCSPCTDADAHRNVYVSLMLGWIYIYMLQVSEAYSIVWNL